MLISVALWEGVQAGRLDGEARFAVRDIGLEDPHALIPGFDPGTQLGVRDLDLLMLSVSDNAATNAVIDLVGMDAVNAAGARLGLTQTVLQRHMLDVEAAQSGRDNLTSAGDIAALMVALARCDGIDGWVAERTLAALGRSQHHDIVPRYLPAGAVLLACKLGELPTVLHTAALVEEGDRRTALVVMSRPAGAGDGLARVAAAAYARLAALTATAGGDIHGSS